MESRKTKISQRHKGNTAILMYGMLREFEICAPSLQRHIVFPANADLFYYGPEEQDIAHSDHKGISDLLGHLKENPKFFMGEMLNVDLQPINAAYGEALKAFCLHSIKSDYFVEQAKTNVPRERWLFGLNPARVFSMFYNIENGVRMVLDYEEKNNIRYDRVIVTRPDLAFYSPIDVFPKPGTIHIPKGEGFDGFGAKYRENVPCFYYRNVKAGDYIEGSAKVRFNDQVIVLSRADLEYLLDLYKNLPEYLGNRIAVSPETILYLHLVVKNTLNVREHPEWIYNIVRKGEPLISSLYDTNELQLVDPYNPISKARMRKRPIMTFLRNAKLYWRKVKYRVLR